MAIAYLIPADGLPSRAKVLDGDALRMAIGGGWLQAVEVRGFGGATMWMDEEGKLKGQAVNRVATALCWVGGSIFDWDTINGDVIVTGPEDAEGNFLDCDSAIGDALESLAGVGL